MQVTQALGEIRSDKLRKEINGVRMQVRRVFYPSAENILIDLNWGATVPERRKSAQHLKNQNSQRPPSFIRLAPAEDEGPAYTYQSTDLL